MIGGSGIKEGLPQSPTETYEADGVSSNMEEKVITAGTREDFVGGRKKYKGKKYKGKKFTSKKSKGKKSKAKKTKTKKNKGKAGAWILHVKSFAKSRGLNFPEALKHPDCKKTYKK